LVSKEAFILVSKEAPAFNYSIREVIINPPILNNSYYFLFVWFDLNIGALFHRKTFPVG
jgi:hypothetical protein